MRLPVKLGRQHHLLFTFYHVQCKEGGKPGVAAETLVGYCCHPLLNKEQAIHSGEFTLPVIAGEDSAYLSASRRHTLDVEL